MNVDAFLDDIPLTLAVDAFNGTSHSPERRGASYRADYANTMAADYEHFHKQAVKGGTIDLVPNLFERYREGYASRYRAWLRSHSRCISWHIAGPSNFPTHRAQKWNDAADRRMTDLIGFRNKVRQAVLRELRPDLRPIMSGDADAIERLAVKLEELERSQERMKDANAVIRKHKKAGAEAQILALVELGFSPAIAAKLLKPDFCGRIGFADYALQNNGANIRRTRERLEKLERDHAKPMQEVEGEGVRIEDDPPANRIRLFFHAKPDAATRGALKARGFRWSPSIGAWQAYRNDNTVQLARSYLKAKEASA